MEDDADGCYRKAIDLLARRPHFRAELERKLLQRDFAAAVVEQTLRRLVELGYLDDEQTARDFVRQRLRRSPEGPRKLRAKLVRLGVADAVVEDTLRELFTEGDSDLARQAADRWRRTHEADPAALARHLDRKGFSKGAIMEIVVRDES